MPFVGFQATHRGNRLCCSAKKQITKNIKDFWNSDYLKNVRNKMLKGEKLDECSRCYDDESLGHISLRNHYNNRYKNFETKEFPTAMDLDVSNFCNLKCIMCSSSRSSQWAKEEGINVQKNGLSTITQEDLDNLCSISSKVKHINIQGGEPSIMPEFEYYFTYLKDNNLIQNIEIDCISNLTNTNTKFYKLLKCFKKVNIEYPIIPEK